MTTPLPSASRSTGDSGHTADHNALVTAVGSLQSSMAAVQAQVASLAAAVAQIPSSSAPLLRYSGTEGNGTLLMSVASAAGSDAHQNAYLSGITVYGHVGSGYQALQFTSVGAVLYTATAYSGPWTAAGASIEAVTVTEGGANYTETSLAAQLISLAGPIASALSIVQPGITGTPQAEAFHPATGLNGFNLSPTGYQRFQYKLTLGNTVEFAGYIQLPNPFSGITFFQLATAYRHNAPVPVPWSYTWNGTGTGVVQCDASGNMSLRNSPSGVAPGAIICVAGGYARGTV